MRRANLTSIHTYTLRQSLAHTECTRPPIHVSITIRRERGEYAPIRREYQYWENETILVSTGRRKVNT